MSETRVIVNAVTRLIVSPIGLRGATGAGVPDGATAGQIPVYSGTAWAPITVLSGLTKIAVVAALPTPQVTGTLYFVKP